MARAPDLFLESSALIAGVLSGKGAARALLLLSESGAIRLTVSDQVLVESERAFTRKMPRALPSYLDTVRTSRLRVVGSPSPADIEVHWDIISDPTDVLIVIAAMQAGTDFLVTLNRRDFLDDPNVALRSGLRMGTPGDALSYVRQRLAEEDGG